MIMPQPELSKDEARRRLDMLRAKEKRGELTVHDAGEITRMLVILGEHETGGKS
jgi:hypothetical protein